AIIGAGVPEEVRGRVEAGIAVAGTATSLAAIDQELDPYDPARVHGYRLPRGSCQRPRHPAARAPPPPSAASPRASPPTAPPPSGPARPSCSSRCARSASTS